MQNLIKYLRKNKIFLKLDNGDLKISAKKNVIDDDVIFLVKKNKKELVDYLLKKTNSRLIFKANEIKLLPIQDNYILSSSQRRMWMLSQFEAGNIAYNVSGTYRFKGKLNQKLLESSFRSLIKRHEILRTVFKEGEEGEIRQYVYKSEGRFVLGCRDYREVENKEIVSQTFIKDFVSQPFDLELGPLLRAEILQVGADDYIFTYVMHHIICDGWSMGVLIKELLIYYNAYSKGEVPRLEELRIQYKDYAAWQQGQLRGEQLELHKRYWIEEFEGELPLLNLPTDYLRPPIKTYNGGVVNKQISKNQIDKLKSIIQEEGGTLFMGILSLVNVLLYKYSRDEDIIIGSPIAGRDHVDLENQIGFYVNTLALRTKFKGVDTYREILRNVKHLTLGAYEHQVYPFDELVEELNLERDMSRNALFDVMVVLQNIGGSNNQQLGEMKVNPYELGEHTISKFDLTFNFSEVSEAMHLAIEYNSDLYARESIIRFGDHLEQLLEQVIINPEESINQIAYLSEEERKQLLHTFNDTEVGYPREKTVVDLFEEQVGKTPEKIALVYEEEELSYRELNNRSNQLANYLRFTYSIEADDLIGIKLSRGIDMIVLILGILKSGGAYVPIDLEYPEERINYMLEDSSCKVLFDDWEMKRFKKSEESYSTDNLESINNPEDLAYIIYTSGSTGKPKGVMIEHRNVSSFLNWCKTEFETSTFDTVFGVTSICFDLSIYEIFYTLIVGKKLRVLNDALSISNYLPREEAILLNTVPSVMSILINNEIDIRAVKVLNLAGEPIPRNIIERLSSHLIEVRNLYGPSEDTTYSTSYRLKDNYNISIGAPILNTQIYILDDNMSLLPLGVIGEICISGAGLARGYLNRPDLTNEKFVDNPYREGERMYKTGDLGRWLLDGNIEFIGRKDDQVKVRGYRIELGEIKSVLYQQEEIEDAVVLVKGDDSGEKSIVAYVTSRKELNSKELRNSLSKHLPEYMLPDYYVQLEEMPLTPNGKINKKGLPDPEEMGMSTGEEYVAPRNELEEKLVEIWSEVLGIEKEKIGVNDDFVALGGDSIKAMTILSRIQKYFKVKITIENIFKESTIIMLEEQIKNTLWLENKTNNTGEDKIKITI